MSDTYRITVVVKVGTDITAMWNSHCISQPKICLWCNFAM